ncbi:outer membrane lipoprotein carrier protein LolA [Vibrio aestuarianus]|uniref:Outer membrane lipoprotein carrier protein LolA n=1 Tax=Vibrio aestuarianus TaxID=28171 RepID=A0AAX3U864_9VIBR|nr:outer membrane lipoprotein carrier protein LolA [Vibrio aestuarianus]MDE1221382.1 outer membrane lipoprotein carrier protein LolA [Vibrio aestuarianus]MDE1223559.1 outer membrane lipoprotein carrier protein LolA [Vibrio aestuarianus]MDE1264592.1 outer membrane lipoprotein carrier protein LolA [Vibrio aestuarianus]MDE1296591.1 outer membrane lipoprotein carrier protein LolA [Vibrio aestuarianus]MDE1325398.1 outer membrane lipoprotein carrier protein LolA [Vibrio aestuarianus]
MMRRFLWLTLALFSPQLWAQVTDLASLQAQLAKHQIVRGEFTQLRHIEMFEQPLSSAGKFLLDKQNGLLWQQNSPFPVNLVLTQDKLRQTFANQPPQVITEKENPMAFYFSHLFLSVFHGDTQQLNKQFTMTLHTEDGQWQLNLTPRNEPLNSVFTSITLTGRDDIDGLILQEVRGDKTEIQFTNQNHQPERLTHAEQTQFNF